jgi:predicted ATPase
MRCGSRVRRGIENRFIAGTASVMTDAQGGLAGRDGWLQTCVVGQPRGRSARQEPPDEPVIRTPDRRLRVFVSSTLGELADERRAVSRAIEALRLTPVMFELGARPYPPREVYQQYLAQSDVFIGLYWQRYGQPARGMQVSGLEEEFDLSGALPRLLYVKAPAADRDPRLGDLLARIQDDASASYRHFRTPAELGRLVRDDLAVLLSERFAAAAGQAVAAVPPSARTRGPRPLPASTTSLLGRDDAVDEVAGLVERAGVRLVTLTGPGGVGKTRLAVAVTERLRDRFGAGTAFVPLDAVTDPGQVLAAIARAAGADLTGVGAPLEALAETFGDGAWLLTLDNLEQVIRAAPDLGELLARCPGVAMLATSRTVLGLRGEREYPVPPLALPADPGTTSVAEVAASPAVALFVDRARAVRPGFALTAGNAAAVAEICRRLEGLPLAIELAAARTRLLDPAALLARLAASLDALGTGAVDLPERQRSLRATVEWSVGLLEDDERSLLEITAVFTDGWTIPAAAQVADLDEDRVLELSEALARHSLVAIDSTEPLPRSRLLATVRAFVAERLAARPDAAEVGRRHAGYYRALAEQADGPLRGPGRNEWTERLQAEAGNLAAAVRWYLAHDRGPLPHLFRVLYLFWSQQDLGREAWSWVEQLLPGFGTLDPQARAELAWAAAALAGDIGDDTAVLAARQRLAPLLPGIQDPFLHAVARLAMAWTMPVAGDYGGALREAAVSLEELRGQDEPIFTAMAAYTVGALDTALGRYDDASRDLREARDLAERVGGDWLAAGAQVQLGILDVVRGSPDEARPLLEEALDLSLAARSTPFVTLCLAGYALLAFADGDPGRAALLEGAAEGLRRRVGLSAWPQLRKVEADLMTQVRQGLGAARFDRAFTAGSRLAQQQAVAIVRDQRDAGTQKP